MRREHVGRALLFTPTSCNRHWGGCCLPVSAFNQSSTCLVTHLPSVPRFPFPLASIQSASSQRGCHRKCRPAWLVSPACYHPANRLRIEFTVNAVSPPLRVVEPLALPSLLANDFPHECFSLSCSPFQPPFRVVDWMSLLHPCMLHLKCQSSCRQNTDAMLSRPSS